MAVVMPCRSDRSDLGLAPYAHMSDGIIHLILVRKCSAMQVSWTSSFSPFWPAVWPAVWPEG